MNALLDNNIQLVTISGKAGTGKTLLALAAALRERKNYRQIFMARPVVPLSNKDIGYLPGDISAKLDPYMQPLFDNLGVMQMSESAGAKKSIQDLLEEEKLVVAPLAYIRGRSLVRTFFIVDEAQNLTPHEVKTIITRAGESTKFFLPAISSRSTTLTSTAIPTDSVISSRKCRAGNCMPTSTWKRANVPNWLNWQATFCNRSRILLQRAARSRI